MFEELKVKNDELKEVINKIEELTPWDRQQLMQEILESYEPEDNDFPTLYEVVNEYGADEILEHLYDSYNYLGLASLLRKDELFDFVESAIISHRNKQAVIDYLLNELHHSYMDEFDNWLIKEVES